MKKIKILHLLIVLPFFNACSLTVDVDDDDSLGRLTVSAIGNNSDGSISEGGYLDLDVSAFDRDGIASIRIEIPALNIDFTTNSSTRESSQKINQRFTVNDIAANKPAIIYITLLDKDGNTYEKTLRFSVQ